MAQQSPIRPTDAEARKLGRQLLGAARFAALAVLGPDGAPHVSRIALTTAPDGQPMTLISQLSAHTAALMADTQCSVLVGEPEVRGDPLTWPRMTLTCVARFVPHGDPVHPGLRGHYLSRLPKAKLYIDFADFTLAILEVRAAALNGGFGKAFALTPGDLGLPPPPEKA